MSAQERVILYDGDGIPTASVDALVMYDAARETLRAMIAHLDDQEKAATAMGEVIGSQGPAGPLVSATALLALVPMVCDLAQRFKDATGSSASLADIVFGGGK